MGGPSNSGGNTGSDEGFFKTENNMEMGCHDSDRYYFIITYARIFIYSCFSLPAASYNGLD